MWSKIPVLIMLAVFGLVGCAEREHSVRTEMVQTPSTVYYPATAMPRADGTVRDAPVVIEESSTVRTVTETRVDDDESRGVLSTTVHFIGEILALPFRLVGGLLRAIF